MKKILIVTNHSYMLWQFRRELIEELLSRYEVYVSTPFVGHEEDFEHMGCHMLETKLERRGMNPVHDLSLINRYKVIIKSVDPDFIITYSIKPNLYMGILAEKYKIPYAMNVQGLGTAFEKKGLREVVSYLYKRACRNAVTVFFENSENRDYFVEHHIVNNENTTLLKGAGINLDLYKFVPRVKKDKFHFLYLGRIMKEKGIDELYDAVERLYSDNKNFVLDVVGFYEDAYKERTNDLRRKGIVQFYGFQSDPKPYYINSDCVVLPSYHEGMSNVLLEAAATGRMLITSDIAGCREAVDDNKSGYLVKVKDSESLYTAMKKALSLSSEELDKMGKEGRKKMEKEFDKKKVVEETVKACGL